MHFNSTTPPVSIGAFIFFFLEKEKEIVILGTSGIYFRLLSDIREWDKSSTILLFLFNLYDLLSMPEGGLIFISSISPDTYYSNMGYVEPVPVLFPDYTEDDLYQIFLRNQANQKLYSSFLDVVLRAFCRITRQVDELSTAFKPLFEKYCEPLSDQGLFR